MIAKFIPLLLVLATAACGSTNGSGSSSGSADNADPTGPAAAAATIIRLRTLPADSAAPSRNPNTLFVKVGDWSANKGYLQGTSSQSDFALIAPTGSSAAVDSNSCQPDLQAGTTSCTLSLAAGLGAQAAQGLAISVSDTRPSGGSQGESAERWYSTFGYISAAQLAAAAAAPGKVAGDVIAVTDTFVQKLPALAGVSGVSALLNSGAIIGIAEDGQASPRPVAGVSVSLAAGAKAQLVLPTADLSAAKAGATTDSAGIFLLFPQPGEVVTSGALTVDGSAAAGRPTYRLPDVFAAPFLLLLLPLSPTS